MKIDEMEAGPDLDALVAEKVMEWNRLPNQQLVNPGFADPLHYHWNDRNGRSYFDLPTRQKATVLGFSFKSAYTEYTFSIRRESYGN